MAKKKCNFRCPDAERLRGVPYMERWMIYCDCGCTILGNSEEDCKATWRRHVEGRL